MGAPRTGRDGRARRTRRRLPHRHGTDRAVPPRGGRDARLPPGRVAGAGLLGRGGWGALVRSRVPGDVHHLRGRFCRGAETPVIVSLVYLTRKILFQSVNSPLNPKRQTLNCIPTFYVKHITLNYTDII